MTRAVLSRWHIFCNMNCQAGLHLSPHLNVAKKMLRIHFFVHFFCLSAADGGMCGVKKRHFLCSLNYRLHFIMFFYKILWKVMAWKSWFEMAKYGNNVFWSMNKILVLCEIPFLKGSINLLLSNDKMFLWMISFW